MDLTMPRLSDTMEEGTLGRWLKAEGESIEKGEVIAEIQTDKANMDLEAFESGTLQRILVGEGETVPVGQPIAVIGSGDGEAAPKGGDAQADGMEPAPAEVTPDAAPNDTTEPVARDVSAASAPDELSATGTSPRSPEGRIKASPLARRLAQEHGLELANLRGSGPNGRINRQDVERAAAERGAPPPPPPPAASAPSAPGMSESAPASAVPPDGEFQPFTRMQQIVAQRMVESKTQAPHIYVSLEVDMARAMTLRDQVNALGGTRVSVNDLLLKACAQALRAYPLANAAYAEGGIRRNAEVNVGFAVAVEGGLYVPVVRNADLKTLRQIAEETKPLIAKAQENRLTPEELSGGTFTVSNLGMLGVDEFQAVINQPQAAILAAGATVEKPVVEGGRIVIARRMRLTLSADHRVLYGADAAQFLAVLKRHLEEPLSLGF